MNFKMTVEADTIKDLKQRLIEAAMGIEGAEVTHSNPNLNHENFIPQYDPKAQADKQLKEEASIHEMYASETEDVDNSVEGVDNIPSVSQVAGVQGSQPSNGEVDSANMPWDARIHAASRAVNKDGTWRYRRNLEESYIAIIEAQLTGKITPQTPVFEAPQAVMTQAAFTPVHPSIAPSVDAPVITPAQLAIPTMSELKPVHSAETFKKNFLMVMGELSMNGKLTPAYLNQLKEFFGVKEIWEIIKDENKVNQIYNQFVSIGLIQGV